MHITKVHLTTCLHTTFLKSHTTKIFPDGPDFAALLAEPTSPGDHGAGGDLGEDIQLPGGRTGSVGALGNFVVAKTLWLPKLDVVPEEEEGGDAVQAEEEALLEEEVVDNAMMV